ncbi:ATP-binding protein [Streptococcus agalactiae]|uniref:ATP-binding protein n=1 Tax=Streptococcus agalactiae TaxID=1311 RepID=UPI0002F24FD1|nr:ATP-binding protein [Streptococcus agalactiae]EPW72012.1 DNA replication protein [Streptococcus agalactiae BSU451]QBX23522.1 DNA replication protein [Streptococcus phage Javan14]
MAFGLMTRESMLENGIIRDTGKTCKKHEMPIYARKMPNHNNRETEFCWQCTTEYIQSKSNAVDIAYNNQSLLAKGYNVFYKESVLSKEIASATLKNYKEHSAVDTQALNYAKRITRDYVKGMEGNSLLQGPPGVGKSHLSMSIAKNINEMFKSYNQSKSVIFVSVPLLSALVKDTFDYDDKKNSKYSQERMSKLLINCDYLILDDLGKESTTGNTIKSASGWTYTFLFNILDNRTNTIINTNFSRAELMKIYDAAFVDRIIKGAKNNIFKYPDNAESKRF